MNFIENDVSNNISWTLYINVFVLYKVLIEGSALAIRCLCSVIFVVLYPDWGLIPLAVSQVLQTGV